MFGAFLPFASFQLFDTLGFGWAGSLLGFVGAALSIVPIVLLIKGKEIRAKSPFMLDSTFDEEETNQRKDSLGRRRAPFGPSAVAGGPTGAVEEQV
ncbi:hypothetical protein J1614_000040 [Plenodomus biglobosus]|nr:hypothetical protein J1614_000040 [Plenodomus biglobosus]